MKKFSTYDELLAERRRLEAQLKEQKVFIRSEISDIRDKLAPITRVITFFTRFGHPNESTAGKLLKMGSTMGIDLLIGKKLRKAGWLARVALPLVLKFTASRSIDAIKNR